MFYLGKNTKCSLTSRDNPEGSVNRQTSSLRLAAKKRKLSFCACNQLSTIFEVFSDSGIWVMEYSSGEFSGPPSRMWQNWFLFNVFFFSRKIPEVASIFYYCVSVLVFATTKIKVHRLKIWAHFHWAFPPSTVWNISIESVKRKSIPQHVLNIEIRAFSVVFPNIEKQGCFIHWC